MVFNIQKFLTENKLTKQSLREEDNTNLTMPVGGEEDYNDDDDLEAADDWDTPEDDVEDYYEKEPAVADVKPDVSASDMHKKQAELQSLEDKKDALLMQLKSNIITLDQYRQHIGNIPQQIKKLRADLEQAMSISTDDDQEEI